MKITVLILSVLLFANKIINAQGLLAFFSQNGEKFWVIIDGKKINKEPNYLVDSIPFNMKWGKVKIIFEDSKLPSFDKTIQVVDAEDNFCYVKYMIYKTKKGKYDAKVSSFLPLTTSPTPNKPVTQTSQPSQTQTNQTSVSVPNINNPSQNVNMTYQVTTTVNEQGNPTIQVSLPEIQQSTNQTQHIVTQTSIQTQPIQQGQTTITTKPQMQTQPVSNTNCSTPMKDADFQSAKQSIASKSFEDSKLTTAKQIVSANCVLSSQVKEIMDLFGYENTRIEFAKFAYKYTYDKNNYYKVNEGFKFETSIDELNEYLNSGN